MKPIRALILCLLILCKMSSTGFSQDSLIRITPTQARAAMKAKADAEIYAKQSAYKDTIIVHQDSTIVRQQKKIFLKNAELWAMRALLIFASYKILR